MHKKQQPATGIHSDAVVVVVVVLVVVVVVVVDDESDPTCFRR